MLLIDLAGDHHGRCALSRVENRQRREAMRRRTVRIVLDLAVEVTGGGLRLHAESQDVSPFGMFLRTDVPLEVGAHALTSREPVSAQVREVGDHVGEG
ncbi:MAG: hypothetical protein IPL61_03835 [Myxococcales bacterium]|nr:hypothetical protein [Myxococcales bacterium]